MKNNPIHICSNYSTDTRQQTHLYRIMQQPDLELLLAVLRLRTAG